MAKKNKPTETATPASTEKVTLKDLEKEFGLEGRIIRAFIRKLGFKAPAVEGAVGFGPKAKYEWAADSADLATIRKAIKESITE